MPVTDYIPDVVGDIIQDDLTGRGGDWRTRTRGIREGFRFDQSKYLSLVSLGDGRSSIQTVTGYKAGYTLSAPSSGQRPEWIPGAAAAFTAGSGMRLSGAPELGALLSSGQVCTIYARVRYTANGIYHTAVGVGSTASNTPWAELIQRNNVGNNVAVRANGAFQTATGAAITLNATVTQTSTYDGSSLNTWLNGTAGTPTAGSVNPAGMDLFSIGGLGRLTPADYMTGVVYEVIVCDVVHTAAEIAAVHANWLAEEDLKYTTGLVMRLRADADSVTVVGSDVSGLVDIANGHHHEQLSSGSRPAWNTEQLNGYPTISFGVDKYLSTPAATDFAFGTGSWLSVLVIKRPSAGLITNLRSFSGQTTRDGVRIRVQGSELPYILWGSNTQAYPLSFLALPNNTWTVLIIGVDAAASQSICKIGSSAIARDATTVQSAASTLPSRLHGSEEDTTADDDAFVFREELLFNLGANKPTDLIINEIAAYVTRKYGIAV